uniref:DNA 3'-5' helicase n=1 Tax=Fervidicoccus fontis TaxID=683846 RepID=A0A7J3ZKU8_9CREN
MSGNRVPSIRYRVKGWLSREDFDELLKFSDYLGREGLEIKFVINPEKAEKNGYGVEEIREVFSKLSGKIPQRVIEVLESEARKQNSVVLELEGANFVIRPQMFLGERLSALKGVLRYDRKRRVFLVKPGMLSQLLERLSAMGITVIDRTGLPAVQPLPQRIEFTGKLRDYQSEAIRAWEENGRRGVIALPTGSGKTVVGIAAIARLSERTLIIAYTKEQLLQWIEKIEELTSAPKHLVAPFYSEEKRLAPITVSTYQTAYRYIEELAFRFSLLIVDEVHHLPADKFKTIALGMYSPHRMGLSATVVREDGKHTELFPLMGGIVYYKTPQELVERGYLAPFVNQIVKVDLSEEERRRYEELKKVYKALAQGMQFQELLSRAQRGDQKAAQALKVHSELKQLIHKSERKLEAVRRVVEKELGSGSKILIFTQYVDQAEKIGEMLGAPVLTGSTEPKLRKRVLEEFKASPTGVLVITTVGDEGLDVPDVNVGIVVAGTGSRRQFVQRLGRLLRPKPGKIARMYEIIVRGTEEEALARRRKKLSLDELVSSEKGEDLGLALTKSS